MVGGAITPQLSSPPLAAPLQPKTEPRQLCFGFFWPARSTPCVSRTHNPTTTTTSYAPSHHPYTPSPSPFYTARPKLSHNGSVSGFGPNPLPACLLFHEHTAPPPQPPHMRHHTTLCTIHHHRFTWRALNRATTARFRFLAQTPSLPRVCECNAPPPPPPPPPHYLHHLTTSPPLTVIHLHF
jgi:hypothetical protein